MSSQEKKLEQKKRDEGISEGCCVSMELDSDQ